MKYLRFISLIIFSALLLSCSAGGGGGGDDSSGSSDITIVVGDNGSSASVIVEENTLIAQINEFLNIFTPSEAVAAEECAAIPGDITSISILINGEVKTDAEIGGGDPDDHESHCTPLIRTYTVQNGANVFSAIAYGIDEDEEEQVLYTGSTTQTIRGNDSVKIIMEEENECDLHVDVENGDDELPLLGKNSIRKFEMKDILEILEPSEAVAGNAPPTTPNDCIDPELPCRTITHALTIAVAGETVCVAAGEYFDNEGGYEDLPLEVGSDVRILCQGAEHSSVIIGKQYDNEVIIADSGVIIADSGATIEGCRVIVDDNNAGISDNNGPITIDNCIIEGAPNAYSNTGVKFGYDSTVQYSTITNIEGNDTGIHVNNGSPSILNNSITYNGVGINVSGGTPTINNNTISCNLYMDLVISNDDNTAVDARNNSWDHSPPTVVTVCYWNGEDICVDLGEVPDTTGYTLASSPCVGGYDGYYGP